MSQKQKFTHLYNGQWCKGCGICVSLCPQQVLVLDDLGKINILNPDDCNNCKLCEFICPDLAIEVVAKQL